MAKQSTAQQLRALMNKRDTEKAKKEQAALNVKKLTAEIKHVRGSRGSR